MSTPTAAVARPARRALPHGILAAIAFLHLGEASTPPPLPNPHDFLRAAELGFACRLPHWHATPQGIGALVAGGWLEGEPAADATAHVLWCSLDDGVPNLVATFPDDLVTDCPALYEERRTAVEREFVKDLEPRDRPGARFFTTVTSFPVPSRTEVLL